MTSKIMPFNFERLSNNKVFISNHSGFFHIFEDVSELDRFIEGTHQDTQDLKSKMFCFDTEDEQQTYTQLLSSSLSYKYQSSLCAPFLFIVVPTLRCDHNCNYCQVSRVNEDAQGYDLDRSKIISIVNRIIEIGYPPYKIEFQGGEPLLNFNFIQDFVGQFTSVVDEASVEFIIATSASLIDDKIINWAKNYPVSLSVSLDGTKSIHDRNRKHPRNSSHDLFQHGVSLIKKQLGDDKFSTVTTLTRAGIADPQDIIDAHIDVGSKDIFLRPLSPYGFATKRYDDNYTVQEFETYYEKLLRLLIKEYDDLGIVEHNALIHLQRIYNNKFNGYVDLKSPAGYVLGALVFDYTGNIFGSDEARMLHKSYGIKELRIGEVETPLNFSNNNSLINTLASSFISENPGCDECAYQPYCGSDPMHHLSTQLDPVGDKSLSRFCSYQKSTFDIIFRLIDEKETSAILNRWLNEHT